MSPKKPIRWICAGCGEHFTTQAAVDRHDPSHHRIVSTIQENPGPGPMTVDRP